MLRHWVLVESHNAITEQEQPLLDEVFKAWFVLGKLVRPTTVCS